MNCGAASDQTADSTDERGFSAAFIRVHLRLRVFPHHSFLDAPCVVLSAASLHEVRNAWHVRKVRGGAGVNKIRGSSASRTNP